MNFITNKCTFILLRCIRFSVRLIPDFADRSVLVEHVGNNPSAINGEVIKKGEKRKIRHNDILEVLQASHFFKIEFPSSGSTSPAIAPNANEILDGESAPSSSCENDAKKTKLSGSLDSFLKDSALESVGTWKSYSNDCLIIFTSNGIESRRKVRME